MQIPQKKESPELINPANFSKRLVWRMPMSIPRRVRIAPRLKTVLVTAIPQQMAKAPKIAIPGILFKRQKKTISATAGQGTIPVTKASQRSSFHVALFAMKILF